MKFPGKSNGLVAQLRNPGEPAWHPPGTSASGQSPGSGPAAREPATSHGGRSAELLENRTLLSEATLLPADPGWQVLTGDFNGDGHTDLVNMSLQGSALSIFLGRGDATFQAAICFPAGQSPAAIVASDFNGDDRLDLVFANQRGVDTTALVGLGDGSFAAPDRMAAAVHSTPQVADLNRDGAADTAVLNRSGQILVRLGRADTTGTLGPPLTVNPDACEAARDLVLAMTRRLGFTAWGATPAGCSWTTSTFGQGSTWSP